MLFCGYIIILYHYYDRSLSAVIHYHLRVPRTTCTYHKCVNKDKELPSDTYVRKGKLQSIAVIFISMVSL